MQDEDGAGPEYLPAAKRCGAQKSAHAKGQEREEEMGESRNREGWGEVYPDTGCTAAPKR